MPSPEAASSYAYAGCSYPYPYPVDSSSTETPKRGKTRAPRTRMNRPRMMAFWMEVALKVKVVAPVLPTLMNPNRASPSSSISSAWAVAKKARLLKQQEILNTRKDGSKDIYSVSTAAASSAGLVCSSWLQVTLGMVATTTSVHSTSPFSRQDFSVIVVGSTFWTG